MKEINSNIEKATQVEPIKPLKESIDAFKDLFKEDGPEIKGEEKIDTPEIKKNSQDIYKGIIGDSEDVESSDINDKSLDKEKNEPIQNKKDGLEREEKVKDELEKKYPPEHGYTILEEVYLRDENGKIVKDPETGQARRIDFVVVKDGKVVELIEVTSQTADKTSQTAKENRIRELGGNFVRDKDGNLIEIPDNVVTRIERRD